MARTQREGPSQRLDGSGHRDQLEDGFGVEKGDRFDGLDAATRRHDLPSNVGRAALLVLEPSSEASVWAVTKWRVAASYAWARFRTRPAQAGVAAGVLGLAVASLVILIALPTVAGDLLLRRTLADLDPSQRAVSVVVAPEAQPSLADRRAIDAGLRKRLSVPGLGPLRRMVEFRSLAMADGTLFRLGGAENLSTMVRLVDGRMPGVCSPAVCEIIAVGNAVPIGTRPLPDVVVVGRVSQTDPVPFTGGLLPNSAEVLLLADGTEGINEVASLTLIRRVDAWVSTIAPDQVSRPTLARLLVTLPAAAGEISASGVTVSAPDALLNTALKRADVAGRGLAMPIGQTLVLLLAMTALVGLGLRPRHRLAADRLARRGADRSTRAVFDVTFSFLAVAAGTALGVVAGAIACVLMLRRQNLLVGATLRTAWSRGATVGFVITLAALWVLTTIFLRVRVSPGPIRTRRVGVSDLLFLVTIGVMALVLARGGASAGNLADRSDPALWAIPVLTAVGLTCLVARVVPALVSAASRLTPGRSLLAKVALADAVRRPLRPLAAASIVTIAVAFGSFAASYRATLQRGADEQAAFVVPYDFRLDVGSELIRPNHLTPLASWPTVVAGTVATDVLRRGVTLRRSGTTGDTVDILGLDPRSVTSLRSWRSDYGPSPAQLASLLAVPAPSPVGVIIPLQAATLRVDLVGSLVEAEVALVLERLDGSWHEEKTTLDPAGQPTLTLTDADRGGRFLGLRIGQPSYTTERIEHHVQEGNSFVPAAAVALQIRGVVSVGVDGDQQSLPFDPRRFASRQAVVEAQPDGSLGIAIALQGSAALVLPTPSDTPLPALVDPLTASAGVDGLVTVDLGGSPVVLRVVAVAPRFPTVSSRFVVVDQAQLRQRLDLAQPGLGEPSEVWLAADTAAHEASLGETLARPPYAALSSQRRTTARRAARQDPLSRLTMNVLLGSALLAGLLAVGSLALNAVADRAEDESFHRALALEGATDRVLNRLVATRTLGLALAALPIGALGGGFLVSVVVRVVQIGATGQAALPPLRLVVPWALLGAGGVALVVLLGLTATISARLTRPTPPEELLRGRP